MKAGGALLHQPFPLLVPFAPERRITLGETDRRWRNGQNKRGFEPHTEARPVPASVQ
jgi:hypothetical protein